MRNILLYCTVLLSISVACAQKNQEVKLDTDLQKASYAIGLDIAENLKKSGLSEVDVAALAKGLEEALAGGELTLNRDTASAAIQSYMAAKQGQAGSAAAAAGKAFLEANKTKDGIITTASDYNMKY